ncbi:hypothetical protein EYS14_16940 [Alteromonadaceae bacterium M269]|nr:hypothetical protein EYS14_16940 [Alteromonadaceae bacterium M269]
MMKRFIHFLKASAVVSILTAPYVVAQEGEPAASPRYEFDFYDKLEFDYKVDFHSADLMGDTYDVSNGSVRFENVDISIPGNSSLSVELRRVRNISTRKNNFFDAGGVFFLEPHQQPGPLVPLFDFSGSWYFDIPRLTYNVPMFDGYQPEAIKDNEFCTGAFSVDLNNPIIDKQSGLRLHSTDYNQGYMLIIPGLVNEPLLRNVEKLVGAKDADFVTKSKWRVSCKETPDGEGFSVTSPQGVTYTFDIMRVRDFTHGFLTYENSSFKDIYFLVSKVEDRFGNWVKYEYIEGLLSKISSNDNRVINVKFVDGDIVATAHGREWNYKLDGSLVTLPDGRYWRYDFFSSEEEAIPDNFNKPKFADRKAHAGNRHDLGACELDLNVSPAAVNGGVEGSNLTSVIGIDYLKNYPYNDYDNLRIGTTYLEVHHPDGAVGKFWFGISLQGTTNVDPEPQINIPTESTQSFYALSNVRCYQYPSLIKKSVQYASDEEYSWHYRYSNNWGSYDVDDENNITNSPHTHPDSIRRDRSSALLPESLSLPDNVDRFKYKAVKIIKPDDSYVIHYVNRDYTSILENKVVNTSYFDGDNNVIQEQRSFYSKGTEFGEIPLGIQYDSLQAKNNLQQPVMKSASVKLIYSGDISDTYSTEVITFDIYDFPILIKRK